jgi:hypothetical protein
MRLLSTAVLLSSACAPVVDDSGPPPSHDAGTEVAAELAFPPCADLSELWTSRYHAALHADWPAIAVDCDDGAPSLERAFGEAAYVLEHTRFDGVGLPDGYTAPPDDMLAFVSAKYTGLTIDAAATFPSTDVDGRVLHFYPAVAQETGFQVVGNLIHEARHADGVQFLHVACTSGPNEGAPMCDDGLTDTFTEGGTHAIALLYFAWAAARSNWPPDIGAEVRALTDVLVDGRINATDAQKAAWKGKYLVDF